MAPGILRSVLLFALAGLCEIGGGYLMWPWLREGRAVWLGMAGGLVLFLYGVPPTIQSEGSHFGRVYATYGGVFLVLSLLWGWGIDGMRPDRVDLLGDCLGGRQHHHGRPAGVVSSGGASVAESNKAVVRRLIDEVMNAGQLEVKLPRVRGQVWARRSGAGGLSFVQRAPPPT